MSTEILDVDYIVRYCRPNTIVKNRIKLGAFEIRPNENYISVNWISKVIDTNIGLEQIKSTFVQKKFHMKSNGRFVIFNTDNIKSYVYELTGIKISICHKFSPNDPTHAGIFPTDLYETENKQTIMHRIAVTLSKFTHKYPDTIHPIFGDDEVT